MNVKLLVTLMTCVMVVNSQSNISAGEFVQCDDLKSEIESIRQLLKTQQQASGCKECQAIEEIKSQIQEMRDVVIQQQNRQRQGCPPGFDYLPEVGSCYMVIIEKMNWDDATERCRQVMPGMHLAAITSQRENEAVVRYLQLQFSECPFGFDYLPEVDRCFTFVFEGMSWDNATERCRQVMPGVHLAAITSQRKNDAIVRYLKSQFSKHGIGSPLLPYVDDWSHGVWISGQRRNRESCQRGNLFVWKTLNGIEIPFSFTNWVAGQPSCQEGDNIEACVHIVPRSGHAWNDAGCSASYFTLCET